MPMEPAPIMSSRPVPFPPLPDVLLFSPVTGRSALATIHRAPPYSPPQSKETTVRWKKRGFFICAAPGAGCLWSNWRLQAGQAAAAVHGQEGEQVWNPPVKWTQMLSHARGNSYEIDFTVIDRAVLPVSQFSYYMFIQFSYFHTKMHI